MSADQKDTWHKETATRKEEMESYHQRAAASVVRRMFWLSDFIKTHWPNLTDDQKHQILTDDEKMDETVKQIKESRKSFDLCNKVCDKIEGDYQRDFLNWFRAQTDASDATVNFVRKENAQVGVGPTSDGKQPASIVVSSTATAVVPAVTAIVPAASAPAVVAPETAVHAAVHAAVPAAGSSVGGGTTMPLIHGPPNEFIPVDQICTRYPNLSLAVPTDTSAAIDTKMVGIDASLNTMEIPPHGKGKVGGTPDPIIQVLDTKECWSGRPQVTLFLTSTQLSELKDVIPKQWKEYCAGQPLLLLQDDDDRSMDNCLVNGLKEMQMVTKKWIWNQAELPAVRLGVVIRRSSIEKGSDLLPLILNARHFHSSVFFVNTSDPDGVFYNAVDWIWVNVEERPLAFVQLSLLDDSVKLWEEAVVFTRQENAKRVARKEAPYWIVVGRFKGTFSMLYWATL